MKRPARVATAISGPPVVAGLGAVLLWWVVALVANSTVFPTPLESAQGLWSDLGRSGFRENLADTVLALTLSYLAVVLVGTVLGLAVGISSFWSRAVIPLVHSVNSIPKITVFPVFLLVLGLGDATRWAFAFLSGVFLMFLITADAAAGVPRIHLKLAAGLNMSRSLLIRKIVVPNILPSLSTGLRLSFGFTFLGLVLAELLTGESGLGAELLNNVALVRMQNIVGVVIVIAAVALVPTVILRRLEVRTERRFTGQSAPATRVEREKSGQ